MFKDLITETTETLMSAVNKNFLRCPNCHKGRLKKNNVLEHYIEVAAFKFAWSAISSEIGGVGAAVPSPDYRYKCPNCKSLYVLIDGKFVRIKKGGGGTDPFFFLPSCSLKFVENF